MLIFTRIIMTAVLCFMAACGAKSSGYSKVKGEPEKSDMDVVIDHFTATGKQENQLVWSLSSDKAYINNAKAEVHIEGVDLEYYDERGRKTHITGRHGVLYQEKRIMVLNGGVMVSSPNGRKLFTESLVWEEQTRKLYTDAPIRITFPEGDELKGRNLRADMNLNKIIIDQAAGTVRQK